MTKNKPATGVEQTGTTKLPTELTPNLAPESHAPDFDTITAQTLNLAGRQRKDFLEKLVAKDVLTVEQVGLIDTACALIRDTTEFEKQLEIFQSFKKLLHPEFADALSHILQKDEKDTLAIIGRYGGEKVAQIQKLESDYPEISERPKEIQEIIKGFYKDLREKITTQYLDEIKKLEQTYGDHIPQDELTRLRYAAQHLPTSALNGLRGEIGTRALRAIDTGSLSDVARREEELNHLVRAGGILFDANQENLLGDVTELYKFARSSGFTLPPEHDKYNTATMSDILRAAWRGIAKRPDPAIEESALHVATLVAHAGSTDAVRKEAKDILKVGTQIALEGARTQALRGLTTELTATLTHHQLLYKIEAQIQETENRLVKHVNELAHSGPNNTDLMHDVVAAHNEAELLRTWRDELKTADKDTQIVTGVETIPIGTEHQWTPTFFQRILDSLSDDAQKNTLRDPRTVAGLSEIMKKDESENFLLNERARLEKAHESGIISSADYEKYSAVYDALAGAAEAEAKDKDQEAEDLAATLTKQKLRDVRITKTVAKEHDKRREHIEKLKMDAARLHTKAGKLRKSLPPQE